MHCKSVYFDKSLEALSSFGRLIWLYSYYSRALEMCEYTSGGLEDIISATISHNSLRKYGSK
jgi:hypothetical protein